MSSNSPLILASKSPRRAQLLKDSGFKFEVFTLEVEESFPTDLPVNEVAQYLSQKKNLHYREHLQEEIVLTADTTVVLGEQLLEKPGDAQEAVEMITALSGRTHQVITGVTISDIGKTQSFAEVTEVTFKEFSANEIDHYVRTYQPFDKAGAYGIQEWIGLTGVRELKGSYFNVMGLPTGRVYELLTQVFNTWPENMR